MYLHNIFLYLGQACQISNEKRMGVYRGPTISNDIKLRTNSLCLEAYDKTYTSIELSGTPPKHWYNTGIP